MSDELFDPSAHNVDEVNDHLAQQHPDEVSRVLEAEAAGKARTGILSGPHAAQAEATEPEAVADSLGDDDPYEIVRAKDAAGNEYNATRVAALSAGSTVLDKPAFDGFGTPIPTKTFLDLRSEGDNTTTSEEN